MNYPVGFYISNILAGLIGFPLFGMLCASIWRNGGIIALKREADRI
jgi:hypothetical protein